ncbi:lytic transglycosylase domain-containing protein [Alphaproteobacteria bacterium]|nr:lytic transglycosylase domain-containing protein [Alphaproteobacteria bacterium]
MFQNYQIFKCAFAFLIFYTGAISNVWARVVDCEALAAKAEIDYAIPSGIMQGIARVESGRVDLDGKRKSWPWTVNDGVEGLFFEDQASALEFVEVSYANGENSVDVGCMQINTKWHKDNFRDFAEMFDPDVNMAYAASFLITLRNRHGSWDQAIRHYHSNDPGKNETYLRKVYNVMASENHSLPSMPQVIDAVLKIPKALPIVKPKPKPKFNAELADLTKPKAIPKPKSKMKIGLKTLATSKIPEPLVKSPSGIKDIVIPPSQLVKRDNDVMQTQSKLANHLSGGINDPAIIADASVLSGDELIKKRQPHIAKNWRRVLEFRASFANNK